MATTLRRKDARSRAEAIVGPNMTPMVDVILVILIFFMATTVIVGEEWFLGAGLSRPQVAIEGGGPAFDPETDPFELPPPQFTLRLVRVDGQTVIRGLGAAAGAPAVVGSAAAMDAWAQESLGALDAASLVVLIAPAPDVPYEHVVVLHDALLRAGVGQIALAPGSGLAGGSAQ